ncbi:Sec translocon accessory complex subunit YajC [Candidatus Profftia lariciata]|uniref:preprotein translocase subunit YajC n=1 Tax=Candidatus Profftia lariciata TaxID=1987921 RepID=UPI001D024A96|nr:preprotein translocase subunit YajC [Candidatus Profftia lariciata]UDG81789.1 Sec translocon accessory complex subunit YajC [Candidatus Profftia lariciata]
MSLFIPSSIASTEVQNQDSPYSLVIMLFLFGLILYFMILLPQQKRTKEHKRLINAISKGDEVMTNCGFLGQVTKVSETNYITIALNETTEVIIKKDFITAILPKGTIKAL